MFSRVLEEKDMAELINASVSHEMRTPINSVIQQVNNIFVIVQSIKLVLEDVKVPAS